MLNAQDTAPRSTLQHLGQHIGQHLARHLDESHGPLRPCWPAKQPGAQTPGQTPGQTPDQILGKTFDKVAKIGRAGAGLAAWVWPRRELIWNELQAVRARAQAPVAPVPAVRPLRWVTPAAVLLAAPTNDQRLAS